MNTWTGYIFLTFFDLCCHEKWNAARDRWLWWVGGAVVPPVYLCPACHRHSRHSRADARHEKTSMATVPIDCYKDNFLEATDYRLPFLVDLSLSSNNPHWERSVCLKKENLNLEDAVQQHPDQEPRTLLWAVCQGAWLRKINSKRKNSQDLDWLSRCWSLAREADNRWLCPQQSLGGTTTGWAPAPGEKTSKHFFLHWHLSFSWGEDRQSERGRKAAKNWKIFIQNCQKQFSSAAQQLAMIWYLEYFEVIYLFIQLFASNNKLYSLQRI